MVLGIARVPVTYVLPIKSSSSDGVDELTAYLRELNVADLVIVDGSPAEVFALHAALWNSFARVMPPQARFVGLNGKVQGVLTGLAAARYEKVVIADDDVRYDERSLQSIADLLNIAEVVRPQNYFAPQVWHTILDTGRTLINRMTGGDWPGTLGLRRSSLPDGYDANVLFENFEMVRTVRARGGRELLADDVYVARRPPGLNHFASQRVRQAYDEFARPKRMALSLAIFPGILVLFAFRRLDVLGVALLGTVLLAEAGRRRRGASAYFPLIASFAAPLWVAERAICAWFALGAFLFHGGVTYGGNVLRNAASVQPARPMPQR